MGGSLAAGGPSGSPAPTPERWAGAQHLVGSVQIVHRIAGPRRRPRRAIPRWIGVWQQIPASGVGARTDHAHLHDEPPALPGTRGSATGSLPRALRRLTGLRRSAATFLPASAADRDGRSVHVEGL